MHGVVPANNPRHLAGRVSTFVPHCSLRSTDQALVVIPRINMERLGRRAFLFTSLIDF